MSLFNPLNKIRVFSRDIARHQIEISQTQEAVSGRVLLLLLLLLLLTYINKNLIELLILFFLHIYNSYFSVLNSISDVY
jgi:hypothetical protein